MTDWEAAELYNHVLERLRELEATELTREIEATVSRGELRSEVGGESDARQTPLSPHEALIVALRMLVAAVEPPIHRTEAETTLETTISWRFDELEPRHLQHEADTLVFPEPRAATWAAPELPSLTKADLVALRKRATELLELVWEIEKEGDDANGR